MGDLAGARAALTATPPTVSGFLWEKTTTQPHVDSGEFRRVGVIRTPWPAFVACASAAAIAGSGAALATVLHTVATVAAELKAEPERTVGLAMERQGL